MATPGPDGNFAGGISLIRASLLFQSGCISNAVYLWCNFEGVFAEWDGSGHLNFSRWRFQRAYATLS
jgi:hypothetical protein